MLANFGWQAGLLGMALLTMQSPGYGFDSALVEFANGNRSQVLRIAGQIKSSQIFFPTASTKIVLYWDWNLAYWRAARIDPETGLRQTLFDFGVGPDFRWIDRTGRGLFAETGIGVHGLTEDYGNNGRRLSTKLQFLSHLGVGYVFGNAVFLSLRVEHISNASIKQPNDGVNFVSIRLGRSF